MFQPQATPRVKFILYVDNYPKDLICWEDDILAFFREYNDESIVPCLYKLFEQKVVLPPDFDELKKEVELLTNSKPLPRFDPLLDSIGYFLPQAEECVYLREKRVDLQSLLVDLIDDWQEALQQDPDQPTADKVITTTFDEIEDHGFVVSSDSNFATLAEVLWTEVLDYWGGTCWNAAELAVNDMNPAQREKLNLPELIDLMHWACIETR